MKLYSHAQLIKTTLICVVAAVLLTAAICVNISKNKQSSNTGENLEITEVTSSESTEAASSPEESAGFLEQNPASLISVAGGTANSGYTQEEAQNINVYSLMIHFEYWRYKNSFLATDDIIKIFNIVELRNLVLACCKGENCISIETERSSNLIERNCSPYDVAQKLLT